MAHSYGGVVTMDLAARMKADFMSRVAGIYFTDRSVRHDCTVTLYTTNLKLKSLFSQISQLVYNSLSLCIMLLDNYRLKSDLELYACGKEIPLQSFYVPPP